MKYYRHISAALIVICTTAACGAAERPSAAQPTQAARPGVRASAMPNAGTTAAPTETAPATVPPSPEPTAAAAGQGSAPTASSRVIVGRATTLPLATLSANPTLAPQGRPNLPPGDVQQTLEARVGTSFELPLSAAMDWIIHIGDEHIAAPAPDAAKRNPPGPFQALAPGETMIVATGNPTCLKSHPACLRPSLTTSFKVIVR